MSVSVAMSAQQTRYYDAAQLNVIGKAIPTSKDYTRIDTAAYKFNDAVIEEYACHSTGLAVLFATDSPFIKAKWQTSGKNAAPNMTAIAQKGLDLYIRQNGEWVFDRSSSGEAIIGVEGDADSLNGIRRMPFSSNDEVTLTIVMDEFSVEIFEDGRSMSSTVYPPMGADGIELCVKADICKYERSDIIIK